MSSSKTMSVKELWADVEYCVPIYQRAYAWESVHVEELLNDIQAAKDAEKEGRYLIGTIVMHDMLNPRKKVYEVVDGQQRLTTLYLILCALAPEGEDAAEDKFKMSLSFACRSKSTEYLVQLQEAGVSVGDTEGGLLAGLETAYGTAERWIRENLGNSKGKIENYRAFLLDKVMAVRTILPEKIDLAHYFEIMNTRGVQLEKRDVLKARLMRYLPTEKEELADSDITQEVFEAIWNCCADSEGYVCAGLNKTKAKWLIEWVNDWNKVSSWLLVKGNHESNDDGVSAGDTMSAGDKDASKEWTIGELLSGDDDNPKPDENSEDSQDEGNNPPNGKNDEQSGKGADEWFMQENVNWFMVLDFDTFLLQALEFWRKMRNPNYEVKSTFDDSSLIKRFDKGPSSRGEVQQFARVLLFARHFLDKYLIKKSSKGESERDATTYKIKPRANDNNKSLPTALEMIESMFQVSFTDQREKEFTFWIMEQMLEDDFWKCSDKEQEERLLCMLEEKCGKKLSSSKCKYQYGQLGNSRHTLNFLDYLIWKYVAGNDGKSQGFYSVEQEPLKGALEGLVEVMQGNWGKSVSGFTFKVRNSVEHFFPQHPGKDDRGKDISIPKNVDDIGNLCLLTKGQNSARNNLLPEAKVEQYEKDGSLADKSLKFQIMVGLFNEDNKREWRESQIEEHGDACKEVLEKACKIAVPNSQSPNP